MTKPVICCVLGKSLPLFAPSVQFGHKISRAGARKEDEALRSSRVIVVDSFDALGTTLERICPGEQKEHEWTKEMEFFRNSGMTCPLSFIYLSIYSSFSFYNLFKYQSF